MRTINFSIYRNQLRELCAGARVSPEECNTMESFCNEMEEADIRLLLRFFTLHPNDLILFSEFCQNIRLAGRDKKALTEVIEKYKEKLRSI